MLKSRYKIAIKIFKIFIKNHTCQRSDSGQKVFLKNMTETKKVTLKISQQIIMLSVSKHTLKRNKKSFNVLQKSLTLFMLRSSKIHSEVIQKTNRSSSKNYLEVHENIGKHFVKFSEPVKEKLLSV